MLKKIAVLVLFSLLVSTQSVNALTNPTHFVDTQWSLFDAAGYNSIEVDITPQFEESVTTDGYYFANTVYFRNYTGTNFGGAYAGFQTNGYSGSAWVGKMALFSVWDVGSGIAETGGWGTTFGGEGAGYSVRLKYNWVVGITYRLKIYIDQDAASGDRLWGASLTDTSTGAVTRIGRIYIPVARGKIYGPVTFHERYLGPVDACSSVKKSQVSFTNMTANNGANKATSWNNYNIAKTPECPGIAWLTDLSNGVQSGIATTKPVVAAKPVMPAPVTKTPIAQVPATQVPTPATEKAPVDTPNTVTPNPTTTAQVVATVAATTKTNSKKTIYIAVVSISAIGIAFSAFYTRSYLARKKFLKRVALHFPFDPDIK
jgi:Domain of unknown function (DUF3472)